MMDLADIRSYARHLHRRGVAAVEIQQSDSLVRIRIDPRDAAPNHADAANAPRPAAAAAPAGLVRSDTLGLLRLSHPVQLPSALAPGERVASGQLLALLELGDTHAPVRAPADGVVQAILASDGQRVDYGMPLFQLAPTAR